MTLRFHSQNLEATQNAASMLAAQIEVDAGPFVIALVGELGAGKTAFVQGLGLGLGLAPEKITSPTFVIANEYRFPHNTGSQRADRLVHVDFYRVASSRDVEAIGFWDFFVPGTLLAVEWSNRFPEVLPRDHLVLELERAAPENGTTLRRFAARATGPQSDLVLRRWRDKLCALHGIEHVKD